jgi:tRNA (mo5U34)-methyltransferase
VPTDPPWWHTIELPDGRITPGGWDLRPTAARIPWPGDLRGMRCLDVGTMDGFWAFEMERRGAADVVALDLFDPPRATFLEARGALGSKVEAATRRAPSPLAGRRVQVGALSAPRTGV